MLCQPTKAKHTRIVGDRTPDNVQFFPLLATLFPQAKFIHLVRDGRDCAVSAWYYNLCMDAASLTRQCASIDEFAVYHTQAWVADVGRGLKFAAEHPGRCLTIRYEDLSRHTLTLLRQVCGFLGASLDSAVLQACCAAADFGKLSGGRKRAQEDRNSLFRRGVLGDWRNHFDKPTELALRKKVEPRLSRLRYL
jgi:hypothetical protein